MSTSDVPSTQVKERSGYCRELRYALDIIRNAETDYIEPSVCEKANVLRQPLSLDDRSDCRPCFFDRYRGGLDDLTNPEWDDPDFYEPHLKNYQNVQGVHNFIISYFGHYPPMEAPGSFTASWYNLNCDIPFESGFNGFYWESSHIALPLTNPESWPRSAKGPNPPLPHVRCLMENSVVGDDRLLRGELSAIIQIMRAQLPTKMLRAHLVAPLLLFSTMGPWHIRVLEAYFNGNKLVVRNTDLIDLRDKNDTVLKNLLRWWFGAGIGDTTVLPTKSRA